MAFAIKDIAGVAFFRLGLTGTLFRTDERAIEFLNYDDDGRVAHYKSSYEMALRDGCISEYISGGCLAAVDVGYLNGDGRDPVLPSEQRHAPGRAGTAAECG